MSPSLLVILLYLPSPHTSSSSISPSLLVLHHLPSLHLLSSLPSSSSTVHHFVKLHPPPPPAVPSSISQHLPPFACSSSSSSSHLPGSPHPPPTSRFLFSSSFAFHIPYLIVLLCFPLSPIPSSSSISHPCFLHLSLPVCPANLPLPSFPVPFHALSALAVACLLTPDLQPSHHPWLSFTSQFHCFFSHYRITEL